MTRCPTCQTEYPDDANWCRFDGGKLEVVPVAPSPQQPGALTMGWDAQPEPGASHPATPVPARGKAPSQGRLPL